MVDIQHAISDFSCASVSERNLSYENEFCMQFSSRANQSYFHKNGFALRLALKQRHKGTGKWKLVYASLVNNEVCVHSRSSQDMYGQSMQVLNYLHRFSIPANRFSSVLLKRLKAHNVLSAKATLGPYINKTECWETTENVQHLQSFWWWKRQSS